MPERIHSFSNHNRLPINIGQVTLLSELFGINGELSQFHGIFGKVFSYIGLLKLELTASQLLNRLHVVHTDKFAKGHGVAQLDLHRDDNKNGDLHPQLYSAS